MNDTMDELEQAQLSWFPMFSGQQLKDELYLSFPHQYIYIYIYMI